MKISKMGNIFSENFSGDENFKFKYTYVPPPISVYNELLKQLTCDIDINEFLNNRRDYEYRHLYMIQMDILMPFEKKLADILLEKEAKINHEFFDTVKKYKPEKPKIYVFYPTPHIHPKCDYAPNILDMRIRRQQKHIKNCAICRDIVDGFINLLREKYPVEYSKREKYIKDMLEYERQYGIALAKYRASLKNIKTEYYHNKIIFENIIELYTKFFKKYLLLSEKIADIPISLESNADKTITIRELLAVAQNCDSLKK